MKKRFLSLLMTLALLIGMCASYAVVASAEEIPTLSLFVDESWWPYDTWKGAVCELFNEKAGVKIEVTIAADERQLPLMVASGDMADLVCSSRLEHMANPNVSYALDELQKQFPDISFPVHSVTQFVNTMSDGHFYTVGCGYSPDSVYEKYPGILAEGTGLVLRQDMLDEMGNPEINTFEDLEAVFARVKAEYPDTFPAIFNSIHQFGWVRQMMGVASSNYQDVNGELVWYIRQPEQLDYYKKINQWYRDGYLMSENFAFKTEAEEQELMVAGKAFADFCYGNHADMFNAKVAANGDPYTMTQFLGVLTDEAAKFDNFAGGRGLYITKSTQNLEAAYRALAYAYSDEGMKLLMWGMRNIQRYAFAEPEQVLTIYKKLYSPSSGSTSDGVLVTQFYLKEILSYFNSLALSPQQIIAIVDGQTNELLVQNKAEDLSDVLAVINDISRTNDYHAISTIHGGEHAILSLTETQRQNGWRYLSLVPYSALYNRSITVSRMFVLLIGVTFCISIILALFSAKRDYNQLRSIFHMLHHTDSEHHVNQRESKDVYAYILNNIIRLFLEQDCLKVQVSEKRYKAQVLEMQALQQQINPHFIFNTLNTIYWEAIHMNQHPNTCSQMISDLSELMQYALSDPQEKVRLQDELDYLKHYINIQNVRYGEKFSFILDASPDVLCATMPKMILQPLVENSIYYGIKNCLGNGVIRLIIRPKDGYIVFYVLDSGMGIPVNRLKELKAKLNAVEEAPSRHIGLVNTNRRLVLTYGNKARIHLFSVYEKGTALSFRIPIDNASEKINEENP